MACEASTLWSVLHHLSSILNDSMKCSDDLIGQLIPEHSTISPRNPVAVTRMYPRANERTHRLNKGRWHKLRKLIGKVFVVQRVMRPLSKLPYMTGKKEENNENPTGLCDIAQLVSHDETDQKTGLDGQWTIPHPWRKTGGKIWFSEILNVHPNFISLLHRRAVSRAWPFLAWSSQFFKHTHKCKEGTEKKQNRRNTWIKLNKTKRWEPMRKREGEKNEEIEKNKKYEKMREDEKTAKRRKQTLLPLHCHYTSTFSFSHPIVPTNSPTHGPPRPKRNPCVMTVATDVDPAPVAASKKTENTTMEVPSFIKLSPSMRTASRSETPSSFKGKIWCIIAEGGGGGCSLIAPLRPRTRPEGEGGETLEVEATEKKVCIMTYLSLSLVTIQYCMLSSYLVIIHYCPDHLLTSFHPSL